MRVNLKQAARIAGFKSSTALLYYIKKYNEPEYEIVAGYKVFDPDKLTSWKEKLVDMRTITSRNVKHAE